MCRRNIILTAVCGCFIEVCRTDCLADKSLNIALWQVGRNLARAFAVLQLLGKEPLGSLETIAIHSFLLVCHKVKVGIALTLDVFPVEHTTYLTDKQVGRTAVEHQVMNIHQKMNAAFCLHYLKAIKRCFLKIKRTDKLILIGC